MRVIFTAFEKTYGAGWRELKLILHHIRIHTITQCSGLWIQSKVSSRECVRKFSTFSLEPSLHHTHCFGRYSTSGNTENDKTMKLEKTTTRSKEKRVCGKKETEER